MNREKQTSAAKRAERIEAEQAPAAAPVFDGTREWRFDRNTNQSHPVVGADEAREVLQRWRDGCARDGDAALVDGIGAFMPDDLDPGLYAEAMFATMKRLAGDDDIFEKLLAKAAEPPPPTVAEVQAQQAQHLVHSVHAVAHVLEGQSAFRKKSGGPKVSAICRELLKRGFTPQQLEHAGYGRGTINDAKRYEIARLLKIGEPLPDHLAIRAPGRPRTGDNLRTGTGEIADSNREASRLVAMAAPLLAKPNVKSMRKGRAQTVEGIARQSLSGKWDMGTDDE